MRLDFLPQYEGQIFPSPPEEGGVEIIQRLELPLWVTRDDYGSDKSSVCAAIKAYLQTHLDGFIPRDTLDSFVEDAQSLCNRWGPPRCGDVLQGLQASLRAVIEGGTRYNLLHIGVVRSREEFMAKLKEGYWFITGGDVFGERGDEATEQGELAKSAGLCRGVNLSGDGRILGSGGILMSRAKCYMNQRGRMEEVARPRRFDLERCFFMGVDAQMAKLIKIDDAGRRRRGVTRPKENAPELRNSPWFYSVFT